MYNISVEVIDIQTLIPFDKEKEIRQSIIKTNRLLIVDEDMPGGASAYILQQLLDEQKIYPLLDSQPKLITAKEHRPLMLKTEIISQNPHQKIYLNVFMK